MSKRGADQHWLALIPNWLGDVAMATPALRALAGMIPEGALTVAGRAGGCQLLEGLPWIAGAVTIPARPGWGAMRALGRELHEAAQDGCVIFPHSFRAAFLAWQTGARRRAGYARGGRRFLLTDAVDPYREAGAIQPIYMAREYLDLLVPLGAQEDGAGLELYAAAEERAAVDQALPGEGPMVVLAPGAAFGPSKQWLVERFAAVADRLTEEEGARCVVVTGPGEEETREKMRALCRRPIYVTDADKPSIARLKATIAQCDILIGNDSGPRHIAIAFQKPVICIMGPTSPRYTDSPWERGALLRLDVDCGPCQQPQCSTDHRCMTGISVDQVVAATRNWIAKK